MAKNKQHQNALEGAVLADVVSISRQFLRSIRIDSDFGREDALSGYVCQGTARSLLESMARQVRDTRQRAFTWTGPYGGGKSSLALLLCSLVGGNEKLRNRARAILDVPSDSVIHQAFDAKKSGWLVVPVVGKRSKVSEEIGRALFAAQGESLPRGKAKSQVDVIGGLVSAAEAHPQGVLVVIDELGKFLEAAAHDGDDLNFFQDLAEAASRASGKLIVVGILHQSFEAYAARMGRQTQDEWAKVQGRFVDIPLVAATDEVVELVGRAIEIDPGVGRQEAKPLAQKVAHAINQRRPGSPANLGESIARCWPLHPVVAALLGPISRRRFSQNERSTFGFLASREPLGFVEFLQAKPIDWRSMYDPGRYWDYLRANLEPAILASPDGHRWAVAAEAVERAEAKGTLLHIELTKSVALIELFRGGSGLVPQLSILEICSQGADTQQVTAALRDLVHWKILIERRHLNSFAIFAGSDFDIEAAINQVRSEMSEPDLKVLSALTDLQPVVAKRLYHKTGTMRWFTRRLVSFADVEREVKSYRVDRGSSGAFLLALPPVGSNAGSVRSHLKHLSQDRAALRLVLGSPDNAGRISELALELVACERVLKGRSELEGDAVARKELLGRLSAVRASLEDELGDAFTVSKWYWRGELQSAGGASGVSVIASEIAETLYPGCPHIFSELINREEISSNSNKARKELMYRMVSHASQPDLGYEGFPADAGLYYSVVKATGLYRKREDGEWSFGEPYANGRNEAMFSLWGSTDEFLLKNESERTAADLYELWRSEPYGLRTGVMPVLALAFFLAHRGSLALYVDNLFTPELSEAVIDEWLLDPARISFRFVSASGNQSAYLQAVVDSLPQRAPKPSSLEPLDVARSLVGLVLALPNWTKRTTTISATAQAVRGMLLKANDPHKVLFADLPVLLEAQDPAVVREKLTAICFELVAAYPRRIAEVKNVVLSAIDHHSDSFERLNERAKTIKGIAGEFRLEAFIARIETFDGSLAAIEGLISLGCSRPPAAFVDRDVDAALVELNAWAHDFRRAEAIAPMRGRPSNRRAIGLVFGGSKGRDVSATVDIDESEFGTVNHLAAKLLADLGAQRREIALAALAEAGELLLTQSSEGEAR